MLAGTTAKLGDLAEIIGGLSSRECPKAMTGQLPPDGLKEAALVPMSAVGETIDTSKTQRVWVKAQHVDASRPRAALLKARDIILVNRYTPKVQIVDVSWQDEHVSGDTGVRCVPANTLIVIRPKTDAEFFVERSKYLAWLLNHPKTQSELMQLMRGAEVKSMTTEDLANLVIPIPAENTEIEGTNTEGFIADTHRKLAELRSRQHELAELEYQKAQARLYEMALGKRKI